jgi:hypothetical protein
MKIFRKRKSFVAAVSAAKTFGLMPFVLTTLAQKFKSFAIIQFKIGPLNNYHFLEMPFEHLSFKRIPLEHMPLEQIPLEQMPLEQMPLEQMPLEQMSLEQMSLEPMSSGQKSLNVIGRAAIGSSLFRRRFIRANIIRKFIVRENVIRPNVIRQNVITLNFILKQILEANVGRTRAVITRVTFPACSSSSSSILNQTLLTKNFVFFSLPIFSPTFLLFVLKTCDRRKVM